MLNITDAPSTKDEIQAAEDFDSTNLLAPYSIPHCYDRHGRPWGFLEHRRMWQRAENIGEAPEWKHDQSTWQTMTNEPT